MPGRHQLQMIDMKNHHTLRQHAGSTMRSRLGLTLVGELSNNKAVDLYSVLLRVVNGRSWFDLGNALGLNRPLTIPKLLFQRLLLGRRNWDRV